MHNEKTDHPSITFLKSLYQNCNNGFINLRFLPDGTNSFYPVEKINNFPPFLERLAPSIKEHKQNVYFGVAIRQDGDATKQGIIEIPAVWVDVDFKDLSGERKDELGNRIQNFSLRPSIIVKSGNGLHIYWLLKKPVSKNEIEQVENVNKRLALYFFGGDMAATDASRILRLPGTFNYKYPPPRPVVLKEINSDLAYVLDDFDSHLPKIEAIKRTHLPEGWQDELLAGVKEGKRNNALTRLAGRYVGKGLARNEILPILLDTNTRFDPPLSSEEVVGILDSVIKTGQRNHPDLMPPLQFPDSIYTRETGKLELCPEKEKSSHGVDYHLTTLSDVFEYPEPSFIIDKIFVEGTVSVLGAYTGVGKSVVALSIIKAILTGQPLWGKYLVLKTGPVLLIDEETPKSFLRDRVEKMAFDKNLPFYFLHFQGVQLDNPKCFEALMSRIEEVKPVLVIIDSLIRVHKQKEDESTAMAKVLDRLRKIANWGTTVLIIHHHKKGEGPLSQKLRGSSDIPGGVDIEYALVTKDDYLIFSSVKTRIEPLTPIKLRMETENGLEITFESLEGGERDEVLNEVVNVLKSGEAGFGELFNKIKQNSFEVGKNRLRGILKSAVGKELTVRQESRGRLVYGVNRASQLTDIYNGQETEKVKPTFTDGEEIFDTTREGQSINN